MRYSHRLPEDLSASSFAQRLAARRASGSPLLDLTIGNPTAAGLPTPRLLAAADEVEAVYEPDALGSLSARRAVAEYFAQRGAQVRPQHILLTASTSEAYSHLFRLLADPGDNFLVPRPSYPLFEPLAALDAVRLAPYPLRLDSAGHWRPDLDALGAAIDERTRGVLLVHPNNPTGSLWRRAEWSVLEELAAERGIAVLADEVFGDFVLGAAELPTLAGASRALTFVLGGLSKTCGAPHAKLAWTVVSGAEPAVASAMERLAWIGDVYLSVSAAAQAALPRLLGERHTYLAATRARLLVNCEALAAALQESDGLEALLVEAGWTAMVRLPSGADEERTAVRLLEAGVLVHPGYFFDAPQEGFLAVSLLTRPKTFAEGARVLAALAS